MIMMRQGISGGEVTETVLWLKVKLSTAYGDAYGFPLCIWHVCMLFAAYCLTVVIALYLIAGQYEAGCHKPGIYRNRRL